MAAQTNLKVITPLGVIVDKNVDIVVVRTISGYIGILPEHIPLVSTIVASEIVYKINNQESKIQVGQGVLQVQQEFVKILAEDVNEIV